MKKILACLLAAACLLGLVGCSEAGTGAAAQPTTTVPAPTASPEPITLTPGATHTDHPGVEISIESFRDTGEKQLLTILWENSTGYEVIFGAAYVIERLEEGRWVVCNQTDLCWNELAYVLEDGVPRQEVYDLKGVFDISRPGSYRFRSEFFLHDEEERSEATQVWAEFMVGVVTEAPCPEAAVLDFAAQYIRTDGSTDGMQYPGVAVVENVQALRDYCTSYQETYYLDFQNACEGYDEAFFADHFLLLVVLQESSGSIRHEVQTVQQYADGKLEVHISRDVPEVGTCDMAQWHVILELERKALVDSPDDVRIYLDGRLAYDGTDVQPPVPEPAFRTAPEGWIYTPEGEYALAKGSVGWTYMLADGTSLAVIGDQAERPLPKEGLDPIALSFRHAETVYAYVEATDSYEPLDTLGVLMKLGWEKDPTEISVTCWPAAVWTDGSTPEKRVYALDGAAFYAWPGSYVYEIAATWADDGSGCYGRANYYVYVDVVWQESTG